MMPKYDVKIQRNLGNGKFEVLKGTLELEIYSTPQANETNFPMYIFNIEKALNEHTELRVHIFEEDPVTK